MRNGACPKCSSRSVFTARGGLSYGSQGALRAHIEPGFKGIRPTQQAEDLWQYMCADCGYMESYVNEQSQRDFVRQHWIPVPPTG
jgi:hypothetical protein